MNSPKILIVEDDAGILEITLQRFKIEGFTNIITATNGKEGLDKSLHEHPDLILLDVVLPEMNGIEVMNTLRNDSWGKNVPIIVLTNLSPDDNAVRSVVDHQPSYYLIKAETSLDEIVAKAKEVLQAATPTA